MAAISRAGRVTVISGPASRARMNLRNPAIVFGTIEGGTPTRRATVFMSRCNRRSSSGASRWTNRPKTVSATSVSVACTQSISSGPWRRMGCRQGTVRAESSWLPASGRARHGRPRRLARRQPATSGSLLSVSISKRHKAALVVCNRREYGAVAQYGGSVRPTRRAAEAALLQAERAPVRATSSGPRAPTRAGASRCRRAGPRRACVRGRTARAVAGGR